MVLFFILFVLQNVGIIGVQIMFGQFSGMQVVVQVFVVIGNMVSIDDILLEVQNCYMFYYNNCICFSYVVSMILVMVIVGGMGGMFGLMIV